MTGRSNGYLVLLLQTAADMGENQALMTALMTACHSQVIGLTVN
jgi:hypothetical protein